MFEQVFSPQVVGLLCGVFSIIAGVSICAWLLDKKSKRTRRRPRRQTARLGLK
ncbi:hypothetical protein LJC56_09530 [Christensenellaceae bacterium OttesenSCG-928-K19]|nr:hypothetical protein [Christensenellaceae bacterium OttesenSCG-928-K19]